MPKLIESCLVSLDGVTSTPEVWADFDDEDAALAHEALHNFDAFIMGRVTYEHLRAMWVDVSGSEYIDSLNAMPKYVASRTLNHVEWNATLLGPDPSGAIARLKESPGKDLIKYGTSRFDDVLVREGLIDELRLWIRPVVVGQGQRLFDGVDTSNLRLTLSDEKRLHNGSVVLTYETYRSNSKSERRRSDDV